MWSCSLVTVHKTETALATVRRVIAVMMYPSTFDNTTYITVVLFESSLCVTSVFFSRYVVEFGYH